MGICYSHTLLLLQHEIAYILSFSFCNVKWILNCYALWQWWCQTCLAVFEKHFQSLKCELCGNSTTQWKMCFSYLFFKSSVVLFQMFSSGPFQERFFHRNSDNMGNCFLYNSIVGDHITTTLCTCYDSPTVMPHAKFHSSCSTKAWMRLKLNLHQSLITMEK